MAMVDVDGSCQFSAWSAYVACEEPGKFQCSTTVLCINKNWRCDSENDCGDYSDERDCREYYYYYYYYYY